MKPLCPIWIVPSAIVGLFAFTVGGCGTTIGANSGAGPRVSVPAISGAQRVVEDYLKAASTADGSRMHALMGAGERPNETPETLRKTAADRYSSNFSWDVLKAEETGDTAKVIVEVKGAEVDPNPTTFTLTRENGEWRITDSPELNERQKNDDIHIKF
ncbi:MAG: hypothetical protein ACO1SX_04315 [Actinomycetota bacterium]